MKLKKFTKLIFLILVNLSHPQCVTSPIATKNIEQPTEGGTAKNKQDNITPQILGSFSDGKELFLFSITPQIKTSQAWHSADFKLLSSDDQNKLLIESIAQSNSNELFKGSGVEFRLKNNQITYLKVKNKVAIVDWQKYGAIQFARGPVHPRTGDSCNIDLGCTYPLRYLACESGHCWCTYGCGNFCQRDALCATQKPNLQCVKSTCYCTERCN